MKKSIKEIQDLLHPDFEKLSYAEQYYAADDFVFIESHYKAISQKISGLSSKYTNPKEIDEASIVRDAFKYTKVDYYRDLLYPTRNDVMKDLDGYMDSIDFLLSNFEEIDPIAKKRLAESERFGKWGTPKEILEGIMAEFKEKQVSQENQGQTLTPEQALESALKSDAKNQDVSAVEKNRNGEPSKDETRKEGVGLDDEQ